MRAHLLTTTELRRIDGDEETLDPARLGLLHDALSDVAVLVDVCRMSEGRQTAHAQSCSHCVWPPRAASAISSNEHEASVGIIWMMFCALAARVSTTSPSTWPSLPESVSESDAAVDGPSAVAVM